MQQPYDTPAVLPSVPPKRKVPSQAWVGVGAMIISATAFGLLGVLAKLAYDAGAAPISVLFLRFSIAAVVMLGIVWVRGERLPRGRTLGGLVLLGAVGYVLQSLAYFTALTMASAGLVALLLYLYPGLVTILAVVFFKERLTGVKILALLLALMGSALAIGPVGGGQPLGIAFAIGGAVIYAVYITAGSRLTARAGAIPSSTVIISAAAVVYAGLMAAQGPALPTTLAGWLAVAGIALISTVLAIVTFFIGMARVGPTAASTLSAFEPFVSVVAAVVILGEPLSGLQIVGGGLILVAVVLLARSQAARKGPAVAAEAGEPSG